jgi:NADPH2:quinone reductase
VPFGGYAEVACARPERVLHIPDGLTFPQATALPVNYLTALLALLDRGRLQPGETVLVLGAGGGVGSAAVQVAKWHGATVIAATSNPQRAAVAAQSGADHLVVLGEGWRERIASKYPRVDVTFDPVGGALTGEALRLLAPGGRLLIIGFTSNDVPSLTTNRILLRNVDVIGIYLGGYVSEHTAFVSEAEERFAQMREAGFLNPIVESGYALKDAAQALRRIAERASAGKLALTVP